MENLIEKIFKDKNLSDQTISLYKRNLKKLNKNKKISKWGWGNFLNKKKNKKRKIKKLKSNKKK